MILCNSAVHLFQQIWNNIVVLQFGYYKVKGKATSHPRMSMVGCPDLIPVLGGQPTGDVINPAIGCHYYCWARGYVPSHRASYCGRYQFILLGDRGTQVRTTCLRLLCSFALSRCWTHNLFIASPMPYPLSHCTTWALYYNIGLMFVCMCIYVHVIDSCQSLLWSWRSCSLSCQSLQWVEMFIIWANEITFLL